MFAIACRLHVVYCCFVGVANCGLVLLMRGFVLLSFLVWVLIDVGCTIDCDLFALLTDRLLFVVGNLLFLLLLLIVLGFVTVNVYFGRYVLRCFLCFVVLTY